MSLWFQSAVHFAIKLTLACGVRTPCTAAGYDVHAQQETSEIDVCVSAGVGEVIKVQYSSFLPSDEQKVNFHLQFFAIVG